MARVEGGAVTILVTWPELKTQIDTRNLNFRFEENSIAYEVFAIDGEYFYSTTIYKAGVAPDNQSTYDTYRADFEANYKNRITDITSTQPFYLSNEDGYSVVLKNGQAPTANDGYGIAVIGIDGSNYRMLKMDSSGRPVMVGAGTAGSQTGGVITIQGDPAGTPIPISGNITASNASVGLNDTAIPGSSTLIGGSDGTNLRPTRIFDLDTGGGTQWVLGVGLRKAAGGGSVELGTSSDPIRIDPTGTTTQPVSGTVTANQGGSWTVAGTGNFTVVQPTASNLRAQLASETNTGTSVPATAIQAGGSDGVNLRPFFTDSSGRQIVIGAAADGAAATGNPVLVAGSDGTNARSIRTATDGTVRVDPTGTTVQPISITGVNIDAGNSSTTPLGGGGTFTGTGFDTSTYATIGISVFSDRAGTLNLQFSSDNVNWDENIAYVVPASDHVRVTTGPQSRYFRINYVNGGVAQAVFRLQVIEKPVGSYPSTVPVDTVISASDDAIITKSVITGKTTGGGGGYVDVKVNPSGTLTVDVSGSTITANQGTSPWVVNQTQINGSAVATLTSGEQKVAVEGLSADGAAPSGNPVLMAGQDGTNVQSIATDGYGRVQVSITGTSSTQVEGRAPDNTTPVGNPVLIGGSDGANVQTILTDTTGRIVIAPSGASTSSGFSAGEVILSALTTAPVRGTTYTEPSTGAQRSMASSSATDTSAGTGARTVRIIYYTLNAGTVAGPFNETVTLNGTTPVNTVATDICYIEQLQVLTVGSGGVNAGIITLYVSTGGGGGTVWTIATGINRTQAAHHYTPSNKTCFITTFSGGIKGADTAGFILRGKNPTSANAAEIQISDLLRAPLSGNTPIRVYGTPVQIPGPARITAFTLPDSSSSRTYYASFDFYEE